LLGSLRQPDLKRRRCDKNSPSALPKFDKESGDVGEHCLSPEGELRSRPIASSNFGSAEGAARTGPPSLGYFSWRRKKSDQPPGCPRQTKHSAQVQHCQVTFGNPTCVIIS
jgi:hypothetical protein